MHDDYVSVMSRATQNERNMTTPRCRKDRRATSYDAEPRRTRIYHDDIRRAQH